MICLASWIGATATAGWAKDDDPKPARTPKPKKRDRTLGMADQPVLQNPVATPVVAGPASASSAASPTSSDYKIRPGDVLRITVWKEPDLSGDAVVRPDGKITVQLLGDVTAWLRTTGEIREEVATGFARFVEEPQVTVAILQANSAKFFIIGQVLRPGSYPLTGQISVLQSIALVGGFSPFAKKNKIVLFRGVDGSEGVIEINFDKLAKGDVRQNFVLQPGDTIFVP